MFGHRATILAAALLAAFLAACAPIVQADEWPQWRGPNRDGVWRETGVLKTFAGKSLKHRWSAPIGSGYSGPTVADGRVFVTDRVVEPNSDMPKQFERVHALDAKTGAVVWSYQYDCPYERVGYTAGPRASVTLDGGRAYTLGTMGHLHCFDAARGTVLWKRELAKDYEIQMPIWGIAASPLVDGDRLIVQIGGKGACIVALDKSTGQERWRALDDRASYSAPIIVNQADKRVLVCWTGDHVAGLHPESGKVHWKVEFPPRQVVIGIATPVVDRGRLFVTNFYDGSLMLKLGENELSAEKLWQRAGPSELNTEALHSIISTPYFKGDSIYGIDSYGQLRCLDAATGERIWENLSVTPKARWSNVHIVEGADAMWMFNERGELIIGQLARSGFTEVSRAKLIEPTRVQLDRRGGVCWSHPAFAYRHVFARNDEQLVCADLTEGAN